MNNKPRLKSVGKFIFVKMPFSMLGINQLNTGNGIIKSLWSSLKNPICPECQAGVIVKMTTEQEGIFQYPEFKHQCSKCEYSFISTSKKAEEHIFEARKARYHRFISDTDSQKEISTIIKNHTLISRIFYVLALGLCFYACYLIGSASPWLLACNYLASAFVAALYAMKRSYRAWQVDTGHVFVPKAFVTWLQYGKWII